MKQVTQTQRQGEVQVVEVPPPVLRPTGLLIRTTHSLISAGTERAKVELAQKSLIGKARARPEQARQVLAAIQQQGPLQTYRKVVNRLEALQPLGYSCSGIVVEVGAEAGGFQVGDRVAGAGAGYANHAEINFVPKNLCVRVPAPAGQGALLGLEAAAFATVGAIALQGVRQADARIGEVVAVVGLGLVGLLTVQILEASGCLVLGMDLNAERCRLAEALGCTAAVTDGEQLAARAAELTEGHGVDAVILTAATPSSEPVALAGRLCRERGRVVVVGDVGLTLPRAPFYEKEIDLRLSRSYGPGRYDTSYEEHGHDYPYGYVRWTEQRNMAAFLDLVARGRINVERLITHRFPFEQADTAYQLITSGSEPYLGVVLEYADASVESLAAETQSDVQPEAGAGVTSATPMSAAAAPARTPVRGGAERVWIASGEAGPGVSDSPAGSGQVTIGMIGAGNFAQDTLLPALKADPRVRLRGVVTASGLSAPGVARRFGFAYAASDPAALLDDPDVDAVVIATRHDSHARLVIQALEAGKAVFVEKPLALDEAQLGEVIAAYEQQRNRASEQAGGRPPLVQVGFNRRFAPHTTAARRLFERVAVPLAIQARVNAGFVPTSHWLHDPQIGGGRIVGEGCHFVDLLIFLAGSEPVELFAQTLPDAGQYRQDNVSVQLRFANGSVGTLQYLANGGRWLAKERVEIFGGGASAVLDDFRRATLGRGGRPKRLGQWWSSSDKGHRAELAAFVDAILTHGPSPLPFAEAVLTSRVTLSILEALRLGRPVALDAATSVAGVDGAAPTPARA